MLQVKKKCCGQCLFSKNKIVSEARKKSLLKEIQKDDTHFICHKATIEKKEIVCRGFYEQRTSQMIRIAQRLNMVEFVS